MLPYYTSGPLAGVVEIPKLFWHLDGIHGNLTRNANSTDSFLKEAKDCFQFYSREVQRGEESGVVERIDIINLILAARAINRSWRLKQDGDLAKQAEAVRDVAKKYGFTRLYDARWRVVNRLEEKLDDDGKPHTGKHCGRCGREIWNPTSLRRGVGPVCYHKPAVA